MPDLTRSRSLLRQAMADGRGATSLVASIVARMVLALVITVISVVAGIAAASRTPVDNAAVFGAFGLYAVALIGFGTAVSDALALRAYLEAKRSGGRDA